MFGPPVASSSTLAEIARQAGTPVYIYSAARIAERYTAFTEAFSGYPHRVHYALKANSTLAVARLVRTLGGGVDANSGGEIDVALRAGFERGTSCSPASARARQSWRGRSSSAST